MASGTKEIHFEEHIVKYLTSIVNEGMPEYIERDTTCFDKDLCLIPEDLIGFIEDTQNDKIVALYQQYARDTHFNIFQHVSIEVK